MHVITLVAMLVVVAALVCKLMAESKVQRLRPIPVKVRRDDDRQQGFTD